MKSCALFIALFAMNRVQFHLSYCLIEYGYDRATCDQ